MKHIAVGILAASFALTGTALAQGQPSQPPRILRVFREDIKSGKGAAHEKVESAYARALAKAGYPTYFALETMTGTSQAWFIEGHDSYESIEKAASLTQKEPNKATFSQLDAQDGELRAGDRGMIATFSQDLSYQPVPPNTGKARFFNITMTRIRPGHNAEFAEMRKILNAAFAKAENKQRRIVYNVTSGAPAGTYLIVSAMESLKSMDARPTGMTMPEAFGPENLARYNKLMSEIVISSEATMFSVNPRMSNPSKEFIAADPDFWTPKPPKAPVKTAEKPTGSQ